MTPTVCVEVDSTVRDTGARVRQVMLEVTEEATTGVFDRVRSPEGVRGRGPYAGCAEALRFLRDERGPAIHFVTRGHDPRAMRAHLHPWLKEHFGSGAVSRSWPGRSPGSWRRSGPPGL